MGLGNNERKRVYVNISKGKCVIKKGDQVELYNYLEGMLTNIEIVDADYEGRKYKNVYLTIVDDTETYFLQMKLDSGYGTAFCKIIKNANFQKPLKIQPTYSEEDGKKKSGMFISQGGVPLKWFYTKDNLGDCPTLEQATFKGETVWDNSKQQNFFMKMLIYEIKPQLPHAAVATNDSASPAPASSSAVFDANKSPDFVDDLPF